MTRVVTACALLLAACSTLELPEGRFQCADMNACPNDWHCHSDGLCYSRAEIVADSGYDAEADTGISGSGGSGGIGGTGGDAGDAEIDAGNDSGSAGSSGSGGTSGASGSGGTGGVDAGVDASDCTSNGEMICDDACVNVLTNGMHCGRCDHACPAAGYCSAGNCVCPGSSSLVACGAECVNSANDNSNCGGCGVTCSSPETCVQGDCRCPTSGEIACDGVCVSRLNDEGNCGSCGNACDDDESCTGGRCVCNGATTETCDGVDNDCDGVTDQGATCPSGCFGHTLRTGIYVQCSTPLSWGGARGVCQSTSLGMHLVRIDSAEENAAVRDLSGTAGMWIGASDNMTVTGGPEGDWEWPDGTLFWRGAANGTAQGGSYTNWATGQPDNAGGGESCAAIADNGTWNDLGCGSGSTLSFVCERN